MGPRLGLGWADAARLHEHGGEENVGIRPMEHDVIQIICSDFVGRNISCIFS
jgi:hypothetical protein